MKSIKAILEMLYHSTRAMEGYILLFLLIVILSYFI